MPWQQLVHDVSQEIDPETGVFAYREVIVTVMRQMGKTAGVILPAKMDRCFMWGGRQRVMYTAQTGGDARKKLLEDEVPVIESSPFKAGVRQVYRARGEEAIHFRNGSVIEVAASAKDSGHGFTVDCGVIDECWADTDNRREQAILPAMRTRPWAQLWVVSTQGTEDSSYLNRKTELGRAAVAEDKGSGIAYFEWSIPEDADIENPEVWWQYMPALGWTVSPAVIAHDLQTMPESEFRRADGNQCVKGSGDKVIPDVLWASVQDPDAVVPQAGRVAFGIDVHPDRTSAAIVASDGKVCELIDHRSGTGWVVERARGLADKYNAVFVVDAGGPAVSLVAELETEVLVEKLAFPEVAAACGQMHDAVADTQVTFRSHELFDIAVAGLAKKPVGDRFVWSRQASTADITPFFAATLAFGRGNVVFDAGFIAFD